MSLFFVDKYSHIPIYEQIIDQAERFILGGILAADSALPSVRALSVALSINPNTIQKAFTELERLGICFSIPGNGRFVSREAKKIIMNRKTGTLQEIGIKTAELLAAGIPIEQIRRCVDEAYEKFQSPSGQEV